MADPKNDNPKPVEPPKSDIPKLDPELVSYDQKGFTLPKDGTKIEKNK